MYSFVFLKVFISIFDAIVGMMKQFWRKIGFYQFPRPFETIETNKLK